MFKFLRRTSLPARRTVEVGWVLDATQATFVWEGPRKLSGSSETRHAKSVNFCPAVLDHRARIFEVPCPIDLALRFQFNEKKEPVLTDAGGDRSTVRRKTLSQMVVVVGRKEWRHPDRPIIQILTPYLFLADETAYMTQLPPFEFFRSQPWPGLVIGGRLPVHIWVRPMMWAFEWHDVSKELVLRRGEPWFYVRFETEDPSRPVRLVEGAMTPALKEYMQGSSAVSNYMNRTFSLFDTARARRPEKLLVAKER
jgi:hypothetical protein